MINSYKDLIVWQKSVLLSVKIYEITENFPREEIFGLTSQMRRSSVSIASNIAEGRGRGTRKDFSQFLRIAFGSCSELQTQIEIAKQLPKTKKFNYFEVENLLMEISKMLNSIITKLQVTKPNS
ncbi:MAG: four helix bundle protein [Candidatus Taylorbacteria bacterium]